jgi:cytochrome c oxidase cbb3-type subunit III
MFSRFPRVVCKLACNGSRPRLSKGCLAPVKALLRRGRLSHAARFAVQPLEAQSKRWRQGLALMLLSVLLLACEREQRRFRDAPPGATESNVQQSSLQPGAPQPTPVTPGPYAENAYAVSEGQRLYEWFNCVGCHAHGGGDIGPPLLDATWIYGSSPENIYQTIVEGRPNGMPSFRHKLTTQQVWQLVAYVRSLSGQLRKDVAPGRPDDMHVKPPAQSKSEEQPRQQRAEHPQG